MPRLNSLNFHRRALRITHVARATRVATPSRPAGSLPPSHRTHRVRIKTMSVLQDSPLCSHEELPSWCKDNAFIVRGYRRPGSGPSNGHAPGSNKDADIDGRSSSTPMTTTLKQRKAGVRNINGTAKSTADDAEPFQHDTIAKCWKSIWAYAHNETINIHTHLWGAVASIVFLGLHVLHHVDALPSFVRPISHHRIFLPKILVSHDILDRFHLPTSASTHTVYSTVDHSANDWKDTAGFTVFLLCALSCLAFSSSYHTLQCHSYSLARKFNALDYVGIVNMIVGSFLPALHYGFYCHPHWQLFYGTCITTLGSGAMWTVLNPKYATPDYRPYRTAVFLALGLSAVFPVAHGIILYGWQVLRLTMGLNYLVTSGALYVAGALLYALRVPERFAPGKFDYFGASHQM